VSTGNNAKHIMYYKDNIFFEIIK